jgi:hypothetical protein
MEKGVLYAFLNSFHISATTSPAGMMLFPAAVGLILTNSLALGYDTTNTAVGGEHQQRREKYAYLNRIALPSGLNRIAIYFIPPFYKMVYVFHIRFNQLFQLLNFRFITRFCIVIPNFIFRQKQHIKQWRAFVVITS